MSGGSYRAGLGLALATGVAVGLVTVGSTAARADDRNWWHDDIHHFHEHDIEVWRGGHWFHGAHAGRPGWWWIVGGVWYFYPAPVYPYPDPYVPPVAAAPPTYYWCPNPAGYYPQVPACSVPWQAVAAAAPPPVAAAPPPPPPPAAVPPPANAVPAPANAPPPPPANQ